MGHAWKVGGPFPSTDTVVMGKGWDGMGGGAPGSCYLPGREVGRSPAKVLEFQKASQSFSM